jgi:hypothetical protein
MENEKIKLSELLLVASNMNNNPTEENITVFEMIKAKLKCRSYLPVKEKELALILISFHLNGVEDGPTKACELETNLIVYGLTKYALNLENDLVGISNLDNICDLIMISGIGDILLSNCKTDYDYLRSMALNMLSWEHIFDLMGVMQDINPEGIEETVNEIKAFRAGLDKETLANLAIIAKNSDPIAQASKLTLEGLALCNDKEEKD